jgi:hypothetical protein
MGEAQRAGGPELTGVRQIGRDWQRCSCPLGRDEGGQRSSGHPKCSALWAPRQEPRFPLLIQDLRPFDAGELLGAGHKAEGVGCPGRLERCLPG